MMRQETEGDDVVRSDRWLINKFGRNIFRNISIEEYRRLCQETDVSPNYDPNFVDYYFGQLGKKLKIAGKYSDDGELIAAFPVHLFQVFPNPIHKRLLGNQFKKIGDIGQPESLFPVKASASKIRLNHFSPVTSPLLKGVVRTLDIGCTSLKSIAVAKERKHKKLTHRQKVFFENGGQAYFTDSLDKSDFAESFLRLFCKRWGYDIYNQRYLREQILHLYDNVFGVILTKDGEPVAAQLCYQAVGKNMLYIDFINSGVKLEKSNEISYGSIMMLVTLRKAEEKARSLTKKLRFSFGYFYGANHYKSVWADPEETFIAI